MINYCGLCFPSLGLKSKDVTKTLDNPVCIILYHELEDHG